MKSGQLPQLIQGMYGAVLGLSIIKIFDNLPAGDIDKKIAFFVKSDTLFQLFFSLFTLAIAAHDWYSFHRAHDNKSRTFLNYLFQIFTIFCIGQMFAFSNFSDFFFWYLFALIYVSLNFFRPRIYEKNRSFKYIYIHFAIAFCGAVVGWFTYFDNTWKLIYLVVTAIVVCRIWFINDKKQNAAFIRLNQFMISTPVSENGAESYTLTLKDFNFEAKKTELAKFAILSSFNNENYESLKTEFPDHIDFLGSLQNIKEDSLKTTIKETIIAVVK
jgi:hypothetical protein